MIEGSIRATPQLVEHLDEQWIGLAVIQRDVRWRPDHDDEAGAVDFERIKHALVRREVRKVVLLLQARVARQLVVANAESLQPLGRDRLRYHDPPGQPAADVVLLERKLVIERVDGRNAQLRGSQREIVGAVSDGEVEAAVAPAEPLHPGRATDQGRELTHTRSAAMTTERDMLDAQPLQQPECLGVVSRGDNDVMPVLAQARQHRPKDERMSGCRHIEPETHRIIVGQTRSRRCARRTGWWWRRST
jgi:hypothetical protein